MCRRRDHYLRNPTDRTLRLNPTPSIARHRFSLSGSSSQQLCAFLRTSHHCRLLRHQLTVQLGRLTGCPDTQSGKIEASQIRRLSTPYTLRSLSTTPPWFLGPTIRCQGRHLRTATQLTDLAGRHWVVDRFRVYFCQRRPECVWVRGIAYTCQCAC